MNWRERIKRRYAKMCYPEIWVMRCGGCPAEFTGWSNAVNRAMRRHGRRKHAGRIEVGRLDFDDLTDDIDDCGTPWDLFDALDDEFQFSIDVASSHDNAKLPRHYTMEEDGLSRSWANERVWCNPPYSNIGDWVEKAWSESGETQLIVMLLPANRTEQNWWQAQVEPYRDRYPENYFSTRFISGRVKFLKPGDVKPRPNSRPPFASVLLIWCPS